MTNKNTTLGSKDVKEEPVVNLAKEDLVKVSLEQRFQELFAQYKDLEARYNTQHDSMIENNVRLNELASIAANHSEILAGKEQEILNLNQIIEGRVQEIENYKAALNNARQTAERLFNMLEGFSRGLAK